MVVTILDRYAGLQVWRRMLYIAEFVSGINIAGPSLFAPSHLSFLPSSYFAPQFPLSFIISMFLSLSSPLDISR